MNSSDVLNWLRDHEIEAEFTAEKRLSQNKYMMYGYWKAIAVHLRKMQRDFKRKFI